MPAPERKSSIRKAPEVDVVEALTSAPAPAAPVQAEAPKRQRKATVQKATEQSEPTDTIKRPGPGRPRSRRRMEPFSSKMEISLRDEVDAYLAQADMTIIDFLDEAVRDRLKKKQ